MEKYGKRGKAITGVPGFVWCAGGDDVKIVLTSHQRVLWAKHGQHRFYHDRACYLAHRAPTPPTLRTCVGCGNSFALTPTQKTRATMKAGPQRSFYHDRACYNAARRGEIAPTPAVDVADIDDDDVS